MAQQTYRLNFGDIDSARIIASVDPEILTTELAHQINNMWANADRRLKETGGDPVIAVLRLFATEVFHHCWRNAIFFRNTEDFTDEVLRAIYEGWPPSKEMLGIQIKEAQIPEVDFDAVHVAKV